MSEQVFQKEGTAAPKAYVQSSVRCPQERAHPKGGGKGLAGWTNPVRQL